MSNSRIGTWSAYAVSAVGAIYLLMLGIGFALFGFSKPIVDPLLAIMEVLTVVSALLLLVLMSAIHAHASREKRTFSLIAFALMMLTAGLTCTVHFVELTALRQLGTAGIVWPSVAYAAELLAWNFMLGLSLLFASRVFSQNVNTVRITRGLVTCGGLCLFGTVGPALGNMQLQMVGIVGYAIVLPIVCLSLAAFFRRESLKLVESAC